MAATAIKWWLREQDERATPVEEEEALQGRKRLLILGGLGLLAVLARFVRRAFTHSGR